MSVRPLAQKRQILGSPSRLFPEIVNNPPQLDLELTPLSLIFREV
jgi:hypothetical protein